jgi:hypothetical protein
MLGWWGVPWGLVMTPVQLVRNLISMASTPDPSSPSPALEKILRHNLAAQILAEKQGSNAGA